jgi:FtsH-binding integral membrane protein
MAFEPNFRAGGPAAGFAGNVGAVDAGLRAYFIRIYNWMAIGLVVTGGAAYAVAETSLRGLFYHMVETPTGLALRPTGLGLLSIFAPLAFVMVMSFGVNRLSRVAVQNLFWAFCVAMGVSLTDILMIYTGESIARAFLVTAGTFGAMSLWGYTTRRDLSSLGSFLFMGLIGLIIAGLANMFFRSSEVAFIASIAGVGIFTLMTAFDTQRIRAGYLQYLSYAGPEEVAKRSVYEALSLYLNFINLFIYMLQFFGVRNNNNNS